MKNEFEKFADNYLEEIRNDLIKKKGDVDASIFEAYLFVFGSKLIEPLKNKLGISEEEATSLFGKAKAKIYDKYSK